MSEQTPEWIEILEPKTQQSMFANLKTGQCRWDEPVGAAVKRTDSNQWWELFDKATQRYYYFNPSSTETVWLKPTNCDIIPLAKLQHLKENTESSERCSTSNSSSHHKDSTLTRGEDNGSFSRSSSRQHNKHSANNLLDEQCYSNFTNDLSSQLPEIGSQSSSFGGSSQFFDNVSTQTEFPSSSSVRKKRFPSASSCRSRNNTAARSKFDSCIQEMFSSQIAVAPEQPPLRNNKFPKDLKSCSTSSSASSCAQSTDLLSQATIDSSVNKTNNSSGIRPTVSGNLSRQFVWTKDPLKTPLLSFTDKKLKKRAISTFKHVQAYMQDRKSKLSQDALVMSLLEDGSNKNLLTDEIFMQIIKQLNENPSSTSLRKGWELLSVILFFFVPISAEVHDDVLRFVEASSDPLLDCPEFSTSRYAKHCLKRLQLPINCFKPSMASIQEARYQIFYPSMFGTSLEELMEYQYDKFPSLKIPWIEHTLISMIEAEAEKAEGLFRLAADPDQLQRAIVQLNIYVIPKCEVFVSAVLLKQWLRQLVVPVIPPDFYPKCLSVVGNPEQCCDLINKLPQINRLVIAHLICLLQRLCDEETVKGTKMDASNLAMVLAPNILRCESIDPTVIFADSRKQMEFVKNLILNYDTSFIR